MLFKEYLSKTLSKNTNGYVFGMSGANIEVLLESLTKAQLNITIAKTENNAVAMAVGSFLKTKKLGVVVTTSGGALLNTLPMVAEAFSSRNPCLIITGLPPSTQMGLGAFQETSGLNQTFDSTKLFEPITCSCKTLSSPEQIIDAIESSLKLAMNEKRPAMIQIPSNFWNTSIGKIEEKDFKLNLHLEKYLSPRKKEKVSIFFKKTNKNKKPLIILGNEANTLTCTKDLKRLILNSQYLWCGTPETKGFFNHHDPSFKGLIGIMGHETANEELSKAEDIIFIGVKNNLMEMYGLSEVLKNKNILCLNQFENYWHQKSEEQIIIHSPLDHLLNELLTYLPLFIDSVDKTDYSFIHQTLQEDELRKEFNLKTVTQQLDALLPKDADLFIDAGNTGANAIHYLNPTGNSLLYISLGMGAMGNSIGVAIGSALAGMRQKEMSKKTIVIIGDGSFLISGLEIHTAIEKNLPIIFILMNNNSHEMCKTREKVFALNSSKGASLNNFKKTNYARGFGHLFSELKTYDINSPAELTNAFSHINKTHSPTLICLNINEEILPPFKSFKEALSQQTGNKNV